MAVKHSHFVYEIAVKSAINIFAYLYCTVCKKYLQPFQLITLNPSNLMVIVPLNIRELARCV